MNDLPLLTLYWSSAFAKQMKPPTLAPYMVALLCKGPCHGQAHTRDPTIGFSPPALLYFRLVIFSAWCTQCLTFPPFFFFLCHVKHFAVPKLQTPPSRFLVPHPQFFRIHEQAHLLWLPGRWGCTRGAFDSRKVLCANTTCSATQGASADIF